MNFLGELRWFCSRASSSVLTCVCVSVCACHGIGGKWGTSLRVCQNGQEVEVARAGWEVDREMTRRKEKMGSFPRWTHPSANQPWAPPIKGGWRHLGTRKKSAVTHWSAQWASTYSHIHNLMCNAYMNTHTHTFVQSVYLLSRNVSVGAGGRPSLWLAIGRDVQEVPDQNGVVVRTADDLEFIKLQAEHAARVLLKTHHKLRNHIHILFTYSQTEMEICGVICTVLGGFLLFCPPSLHHWRWTKYSIIFYNKIQFNRTASLKLFQQTFYIISFMKVEFIAVALIIYFSLISPQLHILTIKIHISEINHKNPTVDLKTINHLAAG